MIASETIDLYFRLAPDEEGYPPVESESVPAHRGEVAGTYILDGLPLFAKVAAIGDLVEAREEDGQLWFIRKIANSGFSLIRIVGLPEGRVEKAAVLSVVWDKLTSMGCTIVGVERFGMLAVGVPPSTKLTLVQAYLQEEEAAGRIGYDEPLLRQ